MSKYKVCVYAICKNESHFVDRWMDAVKEADCVVVCDTGSTDDTVEKLRSRGALVYEERITPWRFDKARNAAMDKIPGDTDICVSNDLDEIFDAGWRQKLEAAWQPEFTRARYMFVWSHNEDGTVKIQYPMEKIHRLKGFRWVHPAHEILSYSGDGKDKSVWVDGLVLHHYPDLSKPRSQYLPLLELSALENPEDDRTIFWLGREYVYHGYYDKAIKTLERHLSLPSAKWDEERSASMRFIARSYEKKGDMAKARTWLYRALAECPDTREPYFELGTLGYQEQNWPLVYAAATKGLCITKKSGSYLMQAECWGYALYDLAAIAAFNMGMIDKSREYALKACEISPEDERLKNNLAIIERRLQEAKKGTRYEKA